MSPRSKTITIGFKVPREELEALDALAKIRGANSRSEYLRMLFELDRRIIANWNHAIKGETK